MNTQTREQYLKALAEAIERRGLSGPAQLMLGAICPIGIIASQTVALFRPFMPHEEWRQYVDALDDEHSWEALCRILERKAG